LDNPAGKVRREDFVRYEKNTDGSVVGIFVRKGKEIRYPDFPAELDVPGKIEVMMWRG
jgi:lysine 2,3-aminomutase